MILFKGLVFDTPFNISEYLKLAEAQFLGLKIGEILNLDSIFNFEIPSQFGLFSDVLLSFYRIKYFGKQLKISGFENLNKLDYEAAALSLLKVGICLTPIIFLCLLLSGGSILMFVLNVFWSGSILPFILKKTLYN